VPRPWAPWRGPRGDQEAAAEAADAPAALELLGRGIDDRLRQIGAGIVDDHGGLAEIALHGGEEIEHGLLVAGIAAIAAGAGLLGDRRHALPIARGRRHQHAGLHEPPAERGAQALSGADDDRHFVCCHPVPQPPSGACIISLLIAGRRGRPSTLAPAALSGP
jgi:hypothetical protein